MAVWLPHAIAFLLLVLPFVPALAEGENGALSQNGKPQEQKSRKLVHDARPAVRLRAALALAREPDVEAVPVLIDLLAESPPAQCQQIEEALRELAGEWAPHVTLTTDDDVSRRSRRQAPGPGRWTGSKNRSCLVHFVLPRATGGPEP